jgi:hypothetical protein
MRAHVSQRGLLIFEILHDEREPSVAEQIGIADEEELNREFHGFAKFHFVERAGANEIAFSAHVGRFVGMTGSVLDLAGVEDVNLRDFDLLMNLPLLELRIARLIDRPAFFLAGSR